MKALDLQVPFFLPVWRRVVLVGVCFVWGILELIAGTSFWGAIVAGLGCYAAWQLFLREWPEDTAL
jgi:hypothetical protein